MTAPSPADVPRWTRRDKVVPQPWRWLPRPTVRLRLTALYATLFVASGAGLLAVTYALVDHHTPVALSLRAADNSGKQIRIQAPGGGSPGPAAGPPGVCLAAGPTPLPGPTSGPMALTPQLRGVAARKAARCATWIQGQVNAARADYLTSLLADSGIALGVMTIAALGLGWLASGRVLRPLRTITLAARRISASNLHERLALAGSDDELKELGDTMDGLLTRLEAAFAAQRQFVGNASHELRTPLTRQRTIVEVALADPDRSVASLEAVCRRVLAAGQQQERLIEALLTLARSQRGLDQVEPVDLAPIARQAMLSRSAEAHHRNIQLTLVDGRAPFPGDARLAERLVTNLIDNAIRHNHPGGRVYVSTSAAPGQATLSVVNSGPEVDPADVPGLFEPFRRRAQARVTADDGLGLGLSIVAAIASAHRARLNAWPNAGGGLVVQVRFDCPAGTQPPADTQRLPEIPAVTTHQDALQTSSAS